MTGEGIATTQSPATWTSRFLRADDLPALLDLVRTAFARWPAAEITVDPLEHLGWKAASDPDALHYGTIAEADGRAVGVQFVFLQRVLVRGRVLRSAQGFDLCVHPDFQNLGVMSEMRAFAWPEYGRTFDMRIGPPTHGPLDKLRRREGSKYLANEVEVLTCPLWSRTPPAKLGRTLFATAVRALWRALDRGSRDAWTLQEVPSFDERIDAFFEEAAKPFEFIIVRSSDYLNWRYADPRSGSFTITLAEQDGRVLGYSVLTMARGRGCIADLLVLPGRQDVLRSLVRHAITSFQDKGLATVECWCPRVHPYRSVLWRHGFVHVQRVLDVSTGTWLAPPDELAFLDDPGAAVHFVAGDTDWV